MSDETSAQPDADADPFATRESEMDLPEEKGEQEHIHEVEFRDHAAVEEKTENHGLNLFFKTEDHENFREVEVPADAYGAAIFAFVYDARELLSGRDHDATPMWLNIYRLCYILAVLCINYVFQFLMLVWIFDYVVQPSVHSVQKTYARYHGEFFTDSGMFQKDVWDGRSSEWDIRFKKQLCHLVFPKFTFLSFVLMLWVVVMVIEFRRNVSLLLHLYALPSCPTTQPELMVRGTGGGREESDADDDKLLIESLTPGIRIIICVLILLPKFIIGGSLTVLGLIWLSATESFSELILNSLALEFVISIDDHLFEALVPEPYREHMSKVYMRIPVRPLTLSQQVQEDWSAWRSSTLFLIAIPCFVFGYLSYFQFLPDAGVLPYFAHDIEQACESFLQMGKERLCDDGFSAEPCFEFGHFE